MKKIALILVHLFLVNITYSQISIIDSLILQTESNEDLPVRIAFGAGEQYTDGLDVKKGEQIIPGPPPQSFYACFTDTHLEPKAINDRSKNDYRGVPDSVKNGITTRFKAIYEIEIFRYAGMKVMITLPRPLLQRGIDSINFVDLQAFGKKVNKTITKGTDTILVNEEGIRYVQMTVYYNYERAKSIFEPNFNTYKLVPNLIGRHNNFIKIPENSTRVQVINSLGQVIKDEVNPNMNYQLNNISYGKYLVVFYGKENYKAELIVQ